MARWILILLLAPTLAYGGEWGLRLAGSPGNDVAGSLWLSLGETAGDLSLKARLEISVLEPWAFRSFGLGGFWRRGVVSLRGNASLSPERLESLKFSLGLSPSFPIGQGGVRFQAGVSLETRDPLGTPWTTVGGYLSLDLSLRQLSVEATQELGFLPFSPGKRKFDLSYQAPWGNVSLRNTFREGWTGSSLDFSWEGDVLLQGYVGISPGGIRAVGASVQGFLGDVRWGVTLSLDPVAGLRPPTLSFTGRKGSTSFSLQVTMATVPRGVSLELRRSF